MRGKTEKEKMRKREAGTEMGCGKKKEMEEQGREATGGGEEERGSVDERRGDNVFKRCTQGAGCMIWACTGE